MAASDPAAPSCQGWASIGNLGGYGSHRCKRPVKDGYNYCGPHLAGKRRSETNQKRAEEERERRQQQRELANRRGVHDRQVMAAKEQVVDLVRDWRASGASSVSTSKYAGMIFDALSRLETLEAQRP